MEYDLNDLVEFPRETLEIELKEWLDLTTKVARANIARHLGALANHGGGYLVFGFKDDLRPDPDRPSSINKFNRDTFTGIVKRYLTPSFQCEVLIVQDKNGDEFPIIRVPSHGQVPIAARTDGPPDDKGRPEGIRQGYYYIRKPGPESAPIIGAEEWAPLIRRCVLNDRDNLLRDIAGLVRPTTVAGLVQLPKGDLPTTAQQLLQWHQDGDERFLQLLGQAKDLRWLVPIKDNRYQLSYLISKDDAEIVPESSLRQVLEEVNNEIRDTVWTGWSMFYPFSSEEIAPTFHPEHSDGTGAEILETNLMGDGNFDTSLPDFWRVAPDGRATLVRAYREDRQRSVDAVTRAPGTWLSPETVIRETTEIVTHARLMARQFSTATKVSFRCTWIGLRGRELNDFDPAVYWSPGRIAKANQRTVEGDWATANLAAVWPSIVAELGCPILRLFGFMECSPEFVQSMAPKFVKL